MGPRSAAALPPATEGFARRLRPRLARGTLLLLLPALIPGARGEEKSFLFQPRSREPLPTEDCPTSCGDLFGRPEEASFIGGRRVQTTQVQERGEPKSGTGFMFEWAMGALAHSCMYLQSAYGEQSCRIEWSFKNRTLIFEPDRAAANPGPCPCDNVEMVSVVLTNEDKHTLPVDTDCGYSHSKGIAKNGRVCGPRDGPEPRHFAELHQCTKDAACRIVDDRLQMSVMRDPRPIAVSSYFHTLRTAPKLVRGVTVDEYVLEFLPTACKWVSVRYILFSEVLADRSALFWYDDAQDSPENWHEAFYCLAGLLMPPAIVTQAAGVAAGRASDSRLKSFPSKGMDVHLGEEEEEAQEPRTFRDEVLPETLVEMDAVLQTWLPPVLLRKLRVGLH